MTWVALRWFFLLGFVWMALLVGHSWGLNTGWELGFKQGGELCLPCIKQQ